MKAAILEGSEKILASASQLLKSSPSVSSVLSFSNPEELLEHVRSAKEGIDVVFLPLNRNVRDCSLNLAAALYQEQPGLPVFFLAECNADFDQTVMLENVNVAGFVCEPLDPQIFERYIFKLFRGLTGRKLLTFFIRGSQYEIKSDEICYIESRGHIAMINTQTHQYHVYEKLSNLKKRLPAVFMQSHKSFLVNMEKVARMEQNSLVLENETVIPISRSRKQEITNGLMAMKKGKI